MPSFVATLTDAPLPSRISATILSSPSRSRAWARLAAPASVAYHLPQCRFL